MRVRKICIYIHTHPSSPSKRAKARSCIEEPFDLPRHVPFCLAEHSNLSASPCCMPICLLPQDSPKSGRNQPVHMALGYSASILPSHSRPRRGSACLDST